VPEKIELESGQKGGCLKGESVCERGKSERDARESWNKKKVIGSTTSRGEAGKMTNKGGIGLTT